MNRTLQTTRCAALAALAGLLLAADGPGPDAVKQELARFQGTWKAVQDGAQAVSDDELKRRTLVIAGDRRTITAGDEVVSLGAYKIDPAKKPREIDLTVTKGPLQDRTLKGIYELDGDTHRICLALTGAGRPKDFQSEAGSGRLVQVFRRAEAGEEVKPGAAGEVREPRVRAELLERVKEDQRIRGRLVELMRKQGESAADEVKKELQAAAEECQAIDAKNTAWMKEVVEKHGWPGRALVGPDGAQAAFLLVQHADRDPEFQKRCLPLLTEAAEQGDAPRTLVAYLTDRVRVAEKQKQLYGTQMRTVDGKVEPHPIEDEANVDRRRKEVGLPPLAEYVKQMQGLNKGKK